MIAIVDYKMGNTGSIQNMLRRLGLQCQLSADPQDLASADRLILPGVGAFDEGMKRLHEYGLIDVLNRLVLVERKPVLGICLGMQLLGRSSEEGSLPGLGWIAAESKRFRFVENKTELRVPHMGWNEVSHNGTPPLFQGMEPEARYYFVHSYYVVCDDSNDIAATSIHGHPFTVAIHHDNICGVQFHPEKSHRFGMALLKNFAMAEDAHWNRQRAYS